MLNYCTLYGICTQTLEVRAPFYTHVYLGDITPPSYYINSLRYYYYYINQHSNKTPMFIAVSPRLKILVLQHAT